MDAIAFVTDFADQAILLPLALIAILAFALTSWWRGAVAWLVVVGATFTAMTLLKMFAFACGHLMPPGLHSPSGHTAAAGMVYGGLLSLVARRLTGHVRWTVPSAVLVAAIIAATRLALGVHTRFDVAVGGVIGVAGAMMVTWLAGAPPAKLRLGPIGVVLVAVLVALHGVRLPAEQAIHAAALQIWPFTLCTR